MYVVNLHGKLTFDSGHEFDIETMFVSQNRVLITLDRAQINEVERVQSTKVSLGILLVGANKAVTLTGQIIMQETVSTLRLAVEPTPEFIEYVERLPELVRDRIIPSRDAEERGLKV